jgi:hypothetical protein
MTSALCAAVASMYTGYDQNTQRRQLCSGRGIRIEHNSLQSAFTCCDALMQLSQQVNVVSAEVCSGCRLLVELLCR